MSEMTRKADIFGVSRFLPLFARELRLRDAQVRRLNDRPACVLGLVFIVQNLAEPVQIESGDVVITLPLQGEVQRIRGSVMV
jgi:hypothetical protein